MRYGCINLSESLQAAARASELCNSVTGSRSLREAHPNKVSGMSPHGPHLSMTSLTRINSLRRYELTYIDASRVLIGRVDVWRPFFVIASRIRMLWSGVSMFRLYIYPALRSIRSIRPQEDSSRTIR